MGNGENRTLTFQIPSILDEQILKDATLSGKSKSAFCREILSEWIWNNNNIPPNQNNDNDIWIKIVKTLTLIGGIGLLIFFIMALLLGTIAITYLKQTGGI